MSESFLPHLEELGDRVMPSATPLLVAAPPSSIEASSSPSVSQEQGSGTYTTSVIVSGAGHEYALTGTGSFASLSGASVSGWVRPVGMVNEGHAQGELTFTNDNGSVTIKLTGPVQSAFSAMPTAFSYTETGTGAYAGLTGTGSLTLTLGQASNEGSTLAGGFTYTIDTFQHG